MAENNENTNENEVTNEVTEEVTEEVAEVETPKPTRQDAISAVLDAIEINADPKSSEEEKRLSALGAVQITKDSGALERPAENQEENQELNEEIPF